MMTEEFLGFFDRATRRIERALNEDSDILIDYSADLDADANGCLFLFAISTFPLNQVP